MPSLPDQRLDIHGQLFQHTAILPLERTLAGLADKVVHAAKALSRAEAGCCYVLDKSKRNLVLQALDPARSFSAMAVSKTLPLFVNGDRNDRHLVAYTAFAGQITAVTDPYRYSGFDFSGLFEQDRIAKKRTYSLLTVPMRNHQGLTIGVIQLTNCRESKTGTHVSFSEETKDVLGVFAEQAAVSFNNLRLIEENTRLIQALGQSNEQLKIENEKLRKKLEKKTTFSEIIGQSGAMMEIFHLVEKVVDTDATVLIQGETGTGKELIASNIHKSSRRRDRGFVAQNCAALPETLLESELFGYKKGAFSGAERDKKGLIELADGGTLFLDEIGDMPINLQSKLLRVLQEGELRPLGALVPQSVDLRVIAATHQDLKAKIKMGCFREDLYYRLAVFPIEMPPLRDRRDDVPLLVRYFVGQSARRYDRDVPDISPGAMECFLSYDYPGNIRELKNLVERAVLMAGNGGTIMPDHLAADLSVAGSSAAPATAQLDYFSDGKTLRDMLGDVEADMIRQKLALLNGNQTRAAKFLGISRRTLIEKMQKYGISRSAGTSVTDPVSPS